MTTTTHKRSAHIDAPVEKVFEFVKEPRHFFAAFPGQDPTGLTEVRMTPEGIGSTYRWTTRMLGFHMSGVMTREEYLLNERIADRSSTGPVWTWIFEPDPAGTTLTLAFDYSTKVPMMDKVVDHLAWKGDRDLDAILANLKQAIEAAG